MEINKALEDWEMRRLAERMSPLEFDKIALDYLEITQIRLDKIREDAGKNSVTYMANSLIMWKNSLEENEARQVLYSKLTKAADEGLFARKNFRFLVTGEEDQNKTNNTWLTIWAIYPLLTAVFLFVEFPRAKDVNYDIMSATFLNIQTFPYHGPTVDTSKLVPLAFGIGVVFWTVFWFVFWSLLLCCVFFFPRFCRRCRKGGKNLKPKKRNRDLCRFVLLLIFLVVSGYYAVDHFCQYANLRYFDVPEEALAENMFFSLQPSQYEFSQYADTIQKSWYKLQVSYECCGVYNYTDWAQIFPNDVPSSCCKIFSSSCGKLSANQAGCAPYLASHINDQVILQSVYYLIYLVLSALAYLIAFIIFLTNLCLFIKRNVTCKNRCRKNDEKKGTALLTANEENNPTTDDDVELLSKNDPVINGDDELLIP